jgi:hypothetical protein
VRNINEAKTIQENIITIISEDENENVRNGINIVNYKGEL